MTTIKNQFVPYNLALQLKELGFNAKCLGVWENTSKELLLNDTNEIDVNDFPTIFTSAPLWQQSFDFFREKCNMNCQIRNNDKHYFVVINKIDYFSDIGESHEITQPFKNYANAQMEALQKLIEIYAKIVE